MTNAPRIAATLLGALSPVLAEWYVDVNAPNCAAGTGSASAPFCNIMDAVNAASGGDTIHVAPGAYVENLLLDKDLTLIGTGGELVTIVDGHRSGSVVTVDSGATTYLTGLTLTNGWASRGGGLFVASSPTSASVVLTDSTVADNTAQGARARGGGIYGSNAVLSLVGSTVSGNVASDPSSYGGGGGIYSYRGVLTLTSSTVSGNTASGRTGHGFGGGIHLYLGTMTLSTSTVSDNTASYGGGIYGNGYGYYAFPYYGATLTLIGSTVSGNDAKRKGGGIFINSLATATLTSSTVSGNTAGASYYYGYGYDGYGGGIFNAFFGVMILQDSTVSGNAAGYGGGISTGPKGIADDVPYLLLGNVTLTNTTVSGNSAYLGGGIYNYRNKLVLERSEVSGNSASHAGGVDNFCAAALIRSSKVSANQATGSVGGIHNYDGSLVLRNSTVSGNAAGFGGGGIDSSSSAYPGYPVTGEIELTNCTVTMNTTTDPTAAGGIESITTAGLTNCILWGNDNAQISAGATVARSIVQGGWTGAGAYNLDADPLFVDPASGLFQLSAGSPAIDAGRNGALSGAKTDLDGNPRFVDDPATPDTGVPWPAAHVPSGTRGIGPIIDLGAYEFQPTGGARRPAGPRPESRP